MEDHREIEARAREIYISRVISHARLKELLDQEFNLQVSVETLKQWGKEQDWAGQRAVYLESTCGTMREKYDVAFQLAFIAFLVAGTDQYDKLSLAMERLRKGIAALPDPKKESVTPDDLL